MRIAAQIQHLLKGGAKTNKKISVLPLEALMCPPIPVKSWVFKEAPKLSGTTATRDLSCFTQF